MNDNNQFISFIRQTNVIAFRIQEKIQPLFNDMQPMLQSINIGMHKAVCSLAVLQKSVEKTFNRALSELKYGYLDKSKRGYSKEIRAACLLWLFLYENNILERNTEWFLRQKLEEFFPGFEDAAQARIITVVRSYGPGKVTSTKVFDDLHLNSLEEVEDKLNEYFELQQMPPFADATNGYRSLELEAACNLWKVAYKNSFNKRITRDFLLGELNTMFPQLGTKAKVRIITMVNAGF